MLRSNTMFTGDVVQAVTHLNRLLVADEKLSLCTICAVVLPDDPDQRPARVVCAGHPLPVLVRDGRPPRSAAPDPMVGAFEDSVFVADEVQLSRRDLLVLYTDGLTDTRGADGRLGSARLHEILTSARCRGRIEIIDEEITGSSMAPRPTTRRSSRSSVWPSPTANSGRSAADPAPVRARLGRWAYRLVTITERRCS